MFPKSTNQQMPRQSSDPSQSEPRPHSLQSSTRPGPCESDQWELLSLPLSAVAVLTDPKAFAYICPLPSGPPPRFSHHVKSCLKLSGSHDVLNLPFHQMEKKKKESYVLEISTGSYGEKSKRTNPLGDYSSHCVNQA